MTRRIHGQWLAVVTSLLFAASAHAATLSIHVDKPVVSQGETIVVTVEGTFEAGDPFLPYAVAFFSYDADVFAPLGAIGQADPITSFDGFMSWTRHSFEGLCNGNGSNPHVCRAIDQINPSAPTIDPAVIRASFLFEAVAPSGNAGSFEFDIFSWFGQTGFPTSPTFEAAGYVGDVTLPGVTVTVAPEPMTAALLGFGLAALTLAGRRHQAR